MPLLIFAFVVIFGVQHFTLPTYLPERAKTGEVVKNAKGDTIFKQIPDFRFTDQSGKTVSQESLAANGMYVVNFFYTSCPVNCRQIASQLTRVQEAFQNNPTVKIASITVKPEQDSVAALQQYATEYHADPAQWHFLRGPKAEIYQLASIGFDLPAPRGKDVQDLIQTNRVLLVDKAHRVRGIYNGTKSTEIDRLIMEINVLLDEYSKSK
ncbi:SCO family protein [Pontibacter chitinilyticus]|uniref:SCO family protein n=1 Tax=Pontibacter chitinilyticus TaxID=2674989 RepID=UPI00321BF87E